MRAAKGKAKRPDPAARPARRQWLGHGLGMLVSGRLGGLLGSLALLPLAGCDFKLRRPPQLALGSVHLADFEPRSQMAGELRRQLLTSPGLRLVESPAEAQVVLRALEDTRDQSVAGSTAAGQVREVTLHSRLRFRVNAADGRELLGDTALELSRPMSYDESDALAKEQEAAMLFRAMERDIAAQVLRRLATMPAPVAPAAATGAAGAAGAEGAASVPR